MGNGISNGVAAAAPGGGALLNVAGSLLLVILLLLAMAWLLARLRRLQSGAAYGLMGVRASLSLGLKERLLIVEAAGQWLLLAVSPGGIQLLHRYEDKPEALEPGAQPQAGNRFAAVLRKMAENR